jgi:hypothetical protein
VFMQAFRDKGRVSSFIKKVPVYAVMVEDLGERGALWVALKVRESRLSSNKLQLLLLARPLVPTSSVISCAWVRSCRCCWTG